MSSDIKELRTEQRRLVVRIMRILALGALLGGVFFLYTEMIMTMEQTRQWLLNDTPRDIKIARALNESTIPADCEDQVASLSEDLQKAGQEQKQLAMDCDTETNELRATVATLQSDLAAKSKTRTTSETATAKLREQADAITSLQTQLEASNAKVLAYEEAVANASVDGPLKRRIRPVNRKFSLEPGKAFYEEKIGLTVSLVSVASHYDAQVRVQLPGQSVVQKNMPPGTQTIFVHAGVQYALVLLSTEPDSGEAEMSLTGKAINP